MAYHHQPIQVPGSAPGSASGSSSSSGIQFHNPSFGDTTDTKLFVGGLPWETDREGLRRHFEQFGEILEAVVIIDKNTRKSKGYGFVTFSDRESAARARADPTPVIDGRRANCNLASRGRPLTDSAYTRPRSAGSFYGGQPLPRGTFWGNSPPYYPSIIYDYQQGIAYPTYGYTGYGPEYYPQNIYSTSSSGGQYLQLQRFPGLVVNSSSVYPYGQFGQRLPSGYDYTSYQGYEIPAHQVLQFRGTNFNGVMTTGTIPAAIQSSYPPATATRVPSRPQTVGNHARPPRLTRDSGVSDQMAA